MSRFTAAAVAAAVLVALPAGAQSSTAHDSLTVARKYAGWFFTGQKDSLWSASSTESKQSTPADEYVTRLEQLTAQVGTEEKVIEEEFVKRRGQMQYWRTSKYSLASEPIMLRLVLDREMRLGGMGMNPASQAPPVDPAK